MRFLFCDPTVTTTIAECLVVFLAIALLWRLVTAMIVLAQWNEFEFFERLLNALISDTFIWNVFFFFLEAFLCFVLAYPQYGPEEGRVFQIVVPLLLGGLEEAYTGWIHTRSSHSSQRIYFQGFYLFLVDKALLLLFQGRGATVAYSRFRWVVTGTFFVLVAATVILPRARICMTPLLAGAYIWLLLLSLYYSGVFVVQYVLAIARRR